MPLFDPIPPPEFDDEGVPCDHNRAAGTSDRQLSKAEVHRKLHAAVPKAIRALEQAMQHGEYGEMIRAALGLLDRAGYGPKSTVQIEELPDDISNMSDAELVERIDRMRQQVLKAQHSVH